MKLTPGHNQKGLLLLNIAIIINLIRMHGQTLCCLHFSNVYLLVVHILFGWKATTGKVSLVKYHLLQI